VLTYVHTLTHPHTLIYFLSFSAVDPAVGKHIIEQAVLGFLKEKTCVLVTHQVQLLQDVDRIVVLNKQGAVLGQGSHADLLGDPTSEVAIMLNKHITVEEKSEEPEKTTKKKKSNKKHGDGHEAVVLRQEEKREKGEVKRSVYTEYFRFVGSCWPFVGIVLINLLSQWLVVGMDYWLAFWVTQVCVCVCVLKRECVHVLIQLPVYTNTQHYTSLGRGLSRR
jgi:ABC-type proline/glycine betaine transport system ATPase subunit